MKEGAVLGSRIMLQDEGRLEITCPAPQMLMHSDQYMDDKESRQAVIEIAAGTSTVVFNFFNGLVQGQGIFKRNDLRVPAHVPRFYARGTTASPSSMSTGMGSYGEECFIEKPKPVFYKIKKRCKNLAYLKLHAAMWNPDALDLRDVSLHLNLMRSRNSKEVPFNLRGKILMVLKYQYAGEPVRFAFKEDPMGTAFKGIYQLLDTQLRYSTAYLNNRWGLYPVMANLSLPEDVTDYLTVLRSVDEL